MVELWKLSIYFPLLIWSVDTTILSGKHDFPSTELYLNHMLLSMELLMARILVISNDVQSLLDMNSCHIAVFMSLVLINPILRSIFKTGITKPNHTNTIQEEHYLVSHCVSKNTYIQATHMTMRWKGKYNLWSACYAWEILSVILEDAWTLPNPCAKLLSALKTS